MIIRGAGLLAEGRRIDGMSGSASVSADWAPVAHRIRAEATDTWNDKVAVDRLVGKGGHFVRGSAQLASNNRVVVGDDSFEARKAVVIATGSSAFIPPIPGLAEVDYWTNREAIEAETLPDSITILGGGAIGVEFAQAWARFGVKVTVIEGADRLVPLEEPEASEVLQRVFTKEGIAQRCGVSAQAVSSKGSDIVVELSDGSEVASQKLLVAVGRRPRMKDLGLESAGIDTSGRGISIDAQMRVTDGIWAVGDCTGKGAFTHVAVYQAGIATAAILGKPKSDADYRALPGVTFTDPEIGLVGMTEAQAKAAGLNIRVGSSLVSDSARGRIHGPGNEGFIKLVEDADQGVLVGATSMGPWGGEVLSILALAVHARVTTQQMREMIYAYPTFHRGIESSLEDLGR
jgi:pyruvate/2-oxoglutarate dehydrogenase complex dihydrolipoamide dehydrogenase (E3) component